MKVNRKMLGQNSAWFAMMQMKKRLLQLLIGLLALVAMVTMQANDALADDLAYTPRFVNLRYAGYTGYLYSDVMLFADANALSTDLAKASVVLSTAAYSQSDAHNLLSQMGYSIVGGQSSYDFVNDLTGMNHVAYSIGVKCVGDYRLYCIPIRGTAKPVEWVGNMMISVGNIGEHASFNLAANELVYELAGIFDNDGVSADKRIVWLTGHSRGGAVANISAGKLNGSRFVASSHLFCYTYASPRVSVDAETCDNIYNFINKDDIVPMVPLKSWGYKRNGIDIFIDVQSQSNVLRRFNNVVGHEYAAPRHTPEEYQACLDAIVPTLEDYDLPMNKLLFLAVGYWLSGSNSYPMKKIVEASGIDLMIGWINELSIDRSFKDLMGYLIYSETDFQEILEFAQDLVRNMGDMSDEEFLRVIVLPPTAGD